jgi:hypothetical protein
MLKLVKTELPVMTEQLLTRMLKDTIRVRDLPASEIRAAYDAIEAIRDTFSRLLDKVDGKDV